MSSSMIAKAAALKPQIRLAQSVSEFVAGLSDEDKAAFRSYESQSRNKPPDPSDVMRLTAEIDHRAVQQHGSGRCFGPRLTNILQAVQQYAALGDIVIGGTQNIIACGVWSLFRLTLLTLVSFSAYMDKLSKLLMVAGRKAPRYERMALLYQRSSDLQSCLSEYFIVVVQLCHQLYKSTRKKSVGSYFSFLSDLDLKEHEANLQLWGDCIKDEVTLLTARKITEQSTWLGALSNNLQYNLSQRRFQNYVRLLEACSTYDHEITWKELRKSGNSTLLAQLEPYSAWKAEKASCTLFCMGKLGFGKSVLLANMVDDLHLNKSTGVAVIFFFCKHDIQQSLRARTIIGSIARQLLSANLSQVPERYGENISALGLDGLLEIVVNTIPATTQAFLILDGLNECDEHERETTLRFLKQLQETFAFNICCSFRSDWHIKGLLESMEILLHSSVAHLPEDNPDISPFIAAELKRHIESGRLCISDPALTSEIQETLVHGAHGMFLWVILQIESLSAAQSDEEIRETLKDLPKGLPETFSRILQKSRGTGEKYQKSIFELCMIAQRPLTTEELREALSVAPYTTDWNPARLINDIFSVLSFCGSLIMIEEESLTVRFLHHSVKQYLLGNFDAVGKATIVELPDADQAMGKLIVTYLNYSMFENSVSTTVVPEMMAQDMPSNIVKSVLRHTVPVRLAALNILKRGKSYQHDLRNALIRARRAPNSSTLSEFHVYAKAFWLWHVQWLFEHQDARAFDLLMALLEKKRVNINDKDDDGQTILWKAISSANITAVRRLLSYGSDTQVRGLNEYTALHLAVIQGTESMTACIIDAGAKIEAVDRFGMTPLLLAAKLGHLGPMRCLLKAGAEFEIRYHNGMTALLIAADEGHLGAIECLLTSGANIEAINQDGLSALSLAARRGHNDVIEYLLNRGAKRIHEDKEHNTPLLLAASRGHQQTVLSLLNTVGYLDLEKRDKDGRTAALLAAYKGHETILESLLDRGAMIEAKDDDGWTPLLLAASAGRTHVVKLLIDRHADVTAEDSDGRTALQIANSQDNTIMEQYLLKHLECESQKAKAQRIEAERIAARADKEREKAANKPRLPTSRIYVRTHDHITYTTINKPLSQARTADIPGPPHVQSQGDVKTEANTTTTAALRPQLPIRSNVSSGARPTTTDDFPSHHQNERNGINASEAHKRANRRSEATSKRTDLFRAAGNGYGVLVESLIEQGADTEVQDELGATPLLRAVGNGHISTVDILFSNGANIHARTADGKTALHISAERGHLVMTQYLLARQVDIHATSSGGNTALHVSAQRGHVEVVQLLLANCARDEDKTWDGRTALHLSAEWGHVQVVKCLLDKGADVETKTFDGKTALSLANEQGNGVVVQHLLSRGRYCGLMNGPSQYSQWGNQGS